MVLGRLFAVIVAIVLVCVAIGAGYIVLNGQRPAVIAPPPGPAPTVTFTSPSFSATDTPTNAKILATFSHSMNSASLTTTTFTVKHGSVVVPGTVTYAGTTATFSPTSNLGAVTAHTATITTGAKDSTGVGLAFDFVWTFTTGPTPDTVPPQVSFTAPAPSSTGIAVNAKVLATFTKAIDPATLTMTSFSVKQGATTVPGIVTYAGTTAVFDPASDFAFSTSYSVSITTGVKDVAGNALPNPFAWTFTTGQLPESVPPRVTSTSTVFAVPIDSSISAMFTEVMDPTSISTSSFLLYQGTTAVPGAVSYAGLTATFNPANNLAYDTTYRASINTAATDLAGNALQSDFVWDFHTGQIPDNQAPRVSSTSAVNDVAIDSSISATFSEFMDPSSVSVASFQIRQGSTVVPGIVTYAGVTATFDPTANFAHSTVYTVTITTGARDLAGNAIPANYVWTFTTIGLPDTEAPRVTSTSPVVHVAIDSSVSAIFSEAMNPATITVSSFTVSQGTTAVAGLVNYAGFTATFNPIDNFAFDTTYTATITTSAKDLAGNPVSTNFVWTFTTGQLPDTGRPTVTAVGPFVGVALDANIQATFSEDMDPTTITTATFLLAQGNTPLNGLVGYTGTTASFDPGADFVADTTYTATITTGARDLAGNTVEVNFVWTFTTRGTGGGPCAQLPVNLGRVSTFAVLAGSTITNTGSTIITGDIGSSPGDAIVGFPPGSFTGTAYISDTVDAAQAMENLTIAYNDAAGRTLCPVDLSGNIGGQTLAPGLYKSTSGMEISSGDLTLDAQGDADAVWIFQIASTLDTSAGLNVILAGGAQAKNIYWQVGTAATLGTNSIFYGTIMADQAVTLATGATLNGRALARIAACDLDANIITVPA